MKIGILGGGQLARMIALAGHNLGIKFITLDPAADACAASVTTHICKNYKDAGALNQLANQTDVVTYEFENVPASSAKLIAAQTPIYPAPLALTSTQDRLTEKTLFRELGIPTPQFAAIASLDELKTYMQTQTYPAVLKTRSEGYDGKGQVALKSPDDLDHAWRQLNGAPAIVEAFVPFSREVSIIGVRSTQGETRFYPLSENTHEKGILIRAIARRDDPMQALAEDYACRLLDRLNYVGVIALELFHTGDQLLANEYAPRVHNTGHWTMEGAETSQFENHLRAILGLPLGSTALIGHAATLNLIGKPPAIADVLAIEHAHLHLYDKAPRAGRKIGHINLRCDDQALFERQLATLISIIKQSNDY
jgi:5-(carboxyamino)imidazole ribonucleotide synthase